MDQNTFALIAEQLYAKLSHDLQTLSLNIQTINCQIPNLTTALSEIRSKVQNCEGITLANTAKLETIDHTLSSQSQSHASSSTPTPSAPRKVQRITKKVILMAKSLYVTEFIENVEMHGSYKKRLESVEIDPEEIPEYLQRQAEKLFEAMTRDDQMPYIRKAQEMMSA
jgi:hypothetical protein